MQSQKLSIVYIYMTVLDQVLQAETAAATAIAEAKATAAQQVADAKKAQADTIEATKAKLAEAEIAALSSYEETVQKDSQALVASAEQKVAAIKQVFETKRADLVTKITDAVA